MRTRSLRLLLPALLCLQFVLAGRLIAQPWWLASCDPAGEVRWQAFAQEVRAAKPGAPLYVPKPYPVGEAQIVADYLYRFDKMHNIQGPGHLKVNLLPNDRYVVDEIVGQRVSYHVTRVENWTQMRCGWQHKQDFYYLVQVAEVASGTEITRAVLDSSGLFVGATNLPVPGPVEPTARRLLPAPAAAMEEVDRDLGVQGTEPEYVATFGTINCDMEFPCLAFRQNGLSFVVYHHEIFEVSANGQQLVRGRDVGTLEKNHELLSTLAPDERLISLGGPSWTIARRVSAAQVRHGTSAFP